MKLKGALMSIYLTIRSIFLSYNNVKREHFDPSVSVVVKGNV